MMACNISVGTLHEWLHSKYPCTTVLDEFDAIARARGGSGGKGDQGDAGVARDSVVNQLLAKMDGMDGLGVPTLLIGLTNQPWLIDPALMRPGRFEVQIEVPKPKTVAQRVAILKVHTESMMKSGRVLAKDAPEGSAAWRRVQVLEVRYNNDYLLSSFIVSMNRFDLVPNSVLLQLFPLIGSEGNGERRHSNICRTSRPHRS